MVSPWQTSRDALPSEALTGSLAQRVPVGDAHESYVAKNFAEAPMVKWQQSSEVKCLRRLLVPQRRDFTNSGVVWAPKLNPDSTLINGQTSMARRARRAPAAFEPRSDGGPHRPGNGKLPRKSTTAAVCWWVTAKSPEKKKQRARARSHAANGVLLAGL